MTCAKNPKLSEELIIIQKPVSCEVCGEHFVDESILGIHLVIHNNDAGALEYCRENPKKMSVKELKDELRKLNLSVVGKKDVLVKRLGGRLAGGY